MAGHLDTHPRVLFLKQKLVFVGLLGGGTNTQMFLIRACVLCINREEGFGLNIQINHCRIVSLFFFPLAEILIEKGRVI